MSVRDDDRRHSGTNRVFVIAAIALMFMGGAAVAFGGWKLFDGRATSEWATTSATVTSAEVVRTSSEPGKAAERAYRVTAAYEVDEQSHTIAYRTNLQSFAPRIGSTVLVRYDPENPADARRGSADADLVAGPVAGALGIAFVGGGLLLFRRSRRGPISLPGIHVTRTAQKSTGIGGE